MTLKECLIEDMKTALKAREVERLGCIRLILAAVKQREVDERIQLDDTAVIGILEKMIKQRQDSINQFERAGRLDLVDKERFELTLIEQYLPAQLTIAEITEWIERAFQAVPATRMNEMGMVVNWLKPHLAGRASMKVVTDLVKDRLNTPR